MTRKRNQSKFNTVTVDPGFGSVRQRLEAEQTGNFGIYHPDHPNGGRMSVREVRDLERASAAQYSDPRVRLPNPVASAPFDRTEPQSRIAKNEAFGFQIQPDRLIDLPPGDAGAGLSVYRRGHFFARLDNPANSSVAGNPMDGAVGMATYQSSDTRPRFWRVSFFGLAVQRVANGVAVPPLTDSEILSQQLKPVDNSGVPTVDFVPAITQLQGRVMVFDESGKRYFDVDILGTRSIDVYSWGVTAFVLGPSNAGTDQGFYQVNRGSGGALPQTSLAGLVEDAIIGIRIIPIIISGTNNPENRTITCLSDALTDTRVPIPPGTRKVQVINHDDAATAGNYVITFDSGNDGTFAGNSTQGVIEMVAAQARSEVTLVPNSVQIIFAPVGGAVATSWSLIFTVDP